MKDLMPEIWIASGYLFQILAALLAAMALFIPPGKIAGLTNIWEMVLLFLILGVVSQVLGYVMRIDNKTNK